MVVVNVCFDEPEYQSLLVDEVVDAVTDASDDTVLIAIYGYDVSASLKTILQKRCGGVETKVYYVGSRRYDENGIRYLASLLSSANGQFELVVVDANDGCSRSAISPRDPTAYGQLLYILQQLSESCTKRRLFSSFKGVKDFRASIRTTEDDDIRSASDKAASIYLNLLRTELKFHNGDERRDIALLLRTSFYCDIDNFNFSNVDDDYKNLSKITNNRYVRERVTHIRNGKELRSQFPLDLRMGNVPKILIWLYSYVAMLSRHQDNEENYSSAFVLKYRSLEIYVTALLFAYNRVGFRQRDGRLLLDGVDVKGFGPYWSALKDHLRPLVAEECLRNIDNIICIRNCCLMSHGLVHISKATLNEAYVAVQSLINSTKNIDRRVGEVLQEHDAMIHGHLLSNLCAEMVNHALGLLQVRRT